MKIKRKHRTPIREEDEEERRWGEREAVVPFSLEFLDALFFLTSLSIYIYATRDHLLYHYTRNNVVV